MTTESLPAALVVLPVLARKCGTTHLCGNPLCVCSIQLFVMSVAFVRNSPVVSDVVHRAIPPALLSALIYGPKGIPFQYHILTRDKHIKDARLTRSKDDPDCLPALRL